MLSGHGSFVRCAVLVSTLSSFLLAPGAFSQVSSSAENHEAFDALLQDQYPNQGGYNRQSSYHHNDSLIDHLAIEAGTGFNVAAGNTGTWQDVGWSVNLGGGWNFNSRFGVLAEYGFNRANIPQSTLTAVGEPNGNVHVWSLTLDPIIYYKTSGRIGGYVTGGGGFYRKLTSFTESVYEGDYCSYFGCYPEYGTEVLNHFSSNQGGVNIGTGVTFKPNADGKAKFYAEARYVWVNSPPTSGDAFGTGTVGMIPITFGFRW